MELTLKNYKTVLPKPLLKMAEKNQVRECDETEAGHYVAYVDEGDDSFDVSITLTKNNAVTAHSCDCKNGKQFCSHATALLLNIVLGKKVSPAVKSRKKISEAELLLEDVQVDKLKQWIKDLLAANKDIELAFVHHFTPQKQSYTTKEVEAVTVNAIKSVVKNKKNIDLTEVKNILTLWKQVHAPIIEAYSVNVGDESLFLNFHAIIETCLILIASFKFPGTKPIKYVEELLQQQLENINNLYNEELWEKASGYFANHVVKNINAVRLHYVIHLKGLIHITSEPRKQKLVARLMQQYAKYNIEHFINGNAYTEIMFDIVETSGCANEYVAVFKPLHFNNDYNKKLISLLMQNKQYKLAEKYAIEQIAGNYKEEYSIPYFLLLKEIYQQQQDEDKLAGVLHQLFPYTFNFEDYLFISNRMQDEEQKKWRTKMFTKARHLFNYNHSAQEFSFRLLAHENKYKKMIELVDSHVPLETIVFYFEPMVQADKNELLKKIFNRGNSYFRYDDGIKNDDQYFTSLFDLMLKHYPKFYLEAAIKQKEKEWSFYRNDFVDYMKGKLGM